MKIDFRSLANPGVSSLTPYQPGKPLEELERELGIINAIKLASNENPLGPSPASIAVAQATLPEAHIYPDGNCYEIKQALSAHFNISPDQLTIGNGSENVLELIVKAYLHRDDSAVISQYAFLTIPIIIQSYGANMNIAKAHHWGHDVEAMLAAIDERTRLLFLVNPNNPTGTYVSRQAFERLMEAVPPNVIVVVDEAYREYITVEDYPDALTYLNQYPNLIITRTFSKAYGLAAMRLGYSISSPEIADMLNRARLPFNVNTLASKMACAALTDHAHVQKSVQLNHKVKNQLAQGLQQLNLKYIPSIGNFITVDVEDGAHVYQQLLQQGVIVRPLKAYHMPKHIRVSVGTEAQNQRFLAALANVTIKEYA